MKFCFSVCEYDPLHNGHVHHISQMKNGGFDAVIIVMSGNFTQRGEIAVLDKYTRAKHAVLAGADMVVELPTVFSTAPAEIFASGAVKIIGSMGGGTLCFGTECGEKKDFLNLAKAMQSETREFKDELKRQLDSGKPFALARANAVKQTVKGINTDLLDNPNCILGIEYTRAILNREVDVDVLPILRVGGGYKEKNAEGKFCSSTAIREAIRQLKPKKIKKYLPDFVYSDLPESLPDPSQAVIFSLLEKSSDSIGETLDCSEGLENRIKIMARSARTFTGLIDRLETKRYTRARLSRIITSSMLGITGKTVQKCLKDNLYVKVLAVAKDKTDLLSEFSEKSGRKRGGVNLVTRKSDADALTGTARMAFEIDVLANDIFGLVSRVKTNEFDMKIIDR